MGRCGFDGPGAPLPVQPFILWCARAERRLPVRVVPGSVDPRGQGRRGLGRVWHLLLADSQPGTGLVALVPEGAAGVKGQVGLPPEGIAVAPEVANGRLLEGAQGLEELEETYGPLTHDGGPGLLLHTDLPGPG
ncbi:MAG TPA: hypothetical protein VD902_18970 [Symbiobacteriaceae bacterium]|nr:hypothetical protein [Symbiobacteriaceae bacterium]